MKHVCTILLALLLSVKGFCCSCGGSMSFCMTYKHYDIAASGVVVEHFDHGISIKILVMLSGTETRDTINVWDLGGPYSMCNDSMINANTHILGEVGDTIVFAFPMIDSAKNNWDVTGDYYKPGFTCEYYTMPVKRDTVRGLIWGYDDGSCYWGNLNCIFRYEYNQFLSEFLSNPDSCVRYLGIETMDNAVHFQYYPNPSANEVVFSSAGYGQVTITNHLGQVVDGFYLKDSVTYSTQNLPSGVYYVKFSANMHAVGRRLVIQH